MKTAVNRSLTPEEQAQRLVAVNDYYCPFCEGTLRGNGVFVNHLGDACDDWRKLLLLKQPMHTHDPRGIHVDESGPLEAL
jgi:hypothetical protein